MTAGLDLGALGMELVLGKGKWNEGFKEADHDVDTHHNKWKDFASNVGGKLAAGITAGVIGIGVAIGGMAVAGVNSALSLQDSMSKFQAATGQTAEETEKVKATIKDLYKTNQDSYDSLAGTAEAMANNMGMSADEIEKYAQKFLDYAHVTKQGNEEVVAAIDDIGDAWGLTNDASVGAMDKMLVLQQQYGMSVTDSQAALTAMAPAAKAAGMSIDETMGYLAMFAQTGVDASVASTAFSKALTTVKNPGELKKLIKDIQDCEDPLKRAQMASDLFGAKAGPKMAQALAESDVSIEKFVESMGNTAGAVDKAAGAYDKSFKVQFDLMKKQIEGMFATLGEKLLPVLQKAMNWVSANMPMIEKFVTSAMDGVGEALEWVMNNIMPALQDALGSLFSAWKALWPSIKGIFNSVWPGIQAALQMTITQVLPVLVQLINTLLPPLLRLVQMILPPLVNILRAAVPVLMSIISSILPVVSTILDALLTPLESLLKTVMPPLIAIFNELIKVVLPPFQKILNMLLPPILQIIDMFMKIVAAVLPPVLELLMVMTRDVLPPLIDIFMVLVDVAIKNVMTTLNNFKPVIDNLIGVFQGVVQFISAVFRGDWSAAWDAIKSIFSNIWDGIKNAFTAAWDSVRSAVSTALSVITGPLEQAWSWVRNIWSGITDSLTRPIINAKETISSIIDGIRGFFSSLQLPEFDLPRIKLPHFNLTGSFSLVPPSVPKLSIDWYDKGGIFYQPTVIGVSEKRPEFVGALDDLKDIVREAVGGPGGDTIIINSPRALSPSETARQMRNAKRQLLLGVTG